MMPAHSGCACALGCRVAEQNSVTRIVSLSPLAFRRLTRILSHLGSVILH
jgi:hypothetical protein